MGYTVNWFQLLIGEKIKTFQFITANCVFVNLLQIHVQLITQSQVRKNNAIASSRHRYCFDDVTICYLVSTKCLFSAITQAC